MMRGEKQRMLLKALSIMAHLSSQCVVNLAQQRWMFTVINWTVVSSVRPILRIGEYSLVALQHRRIRYIGLRVSADADTPAAITINSYRTRRLKHMARVDRI